MNTLIKKSWFTGVLAVIIFLNACRDSDKSSSLIFEELNEGLEQSNLVIKGNLSLILHSFQQRLVKPAFVEKAKFFELKINLINKESDSLYNYIEQLKIELIKDSKFDTARWQNIEQSKQQKAVSVLFIEKHKSDSLYSKFYSYKEKALNTDIRLREEFYNKFSIGSSVFNTSIKTANDFANRFFQNRKTYEVLPFLTKLENEVLLAQYRSTYFFYIISNSNDDSYSIEAPWVFQNSTCLRRGENLELKAIIAEARDNLDFKVIVDGQEIPNDGSSMRIYTKKISQVPGKYNSRVTFKFTNKYGQKEVESQIIKYEVVK